jgi:hypothetical protein
VTLKEIKKATSSVKATREMCVIIGKAPKYNTVLQFIKEKNVFAQLVRKFIKTLFI